jgi:hypothetical protein
MAKKIISVLFLLIAGITVSFAQGTPIFTVVEEMPTYPGGAEARNKFLSENMVYLS